MPTVRSPHLIIWQGYRESALNELTNFTIICVLINDSVHLIKKPVLALIGPTAIGKTALSLELCRLFDCEIISVDSMQVYRYMDIGTAKATREERERYRHHLIDIVNPDDSYNAARFVSDCLNVVSDIHDKGKIPLLTGGTGLYLSALKNGLFELPPTDPDIRDQLQQKLQEEGSQLLYAQLEKSDEQSAARLHPNDSSRIIRALEVYLSTGVTMSEHLKKQAAIGHNPEFARFQTIGLTCARDLLYKRINQRTEQLFELGLESEVRNLLEKGYSPQLQSMQSIGYRHMLNFLDGTWSYDQCVELLARDTRHYAKRQFTWFNRDDSISWFDRDEPDRVIDCIDDFLKEVK